MLVNLQCIAQPTVEPVLLALAKQHCQVDADRTDEDALITAYISAARHLCERTTRRAFLPQTWLLTLDHFPWYDYRNGTMRQNSSNDWPFYASLWRGVTIQLPMPRCISVESISYVDLQGQKQTLDPGSYYVDTSSEPARIVPVPGTYWPYTQQYLPGSVQVKFVAGSFVAQVQNEAIAVPAEAPYQVTLQQGANFLSLTSITDATGQIVIPANQYSVANGVITFQASQEGASLKVNYQVSTMPQTIVLAILQLVATWYAQREDSVIDQGLSTAVSLPKGVDALLAPYKFLYFTFENN